VFLVGDVDRVVVIGARAEIMRKIVRQAGSQTGLLGEIALPKFQLLGERTWGK